MSNVIVIDDCRICERNNVVSINTDFIHQLSYQAIAKRNNLEYNKELVADLMQHFRNHVTSPTQSMAIAMIREEAIALKNTVVETNIALDQVDNLKSITFQKLDSLASDATAKEVSLLVKSYADLIKQQTNLLQLHHKLSGKAQSEDLMKAAMGTMIQEVTKALGEEKIKQIRQNKKKGKKNIFSFFENDPHMIKLVEELEATIDDNQID